MDINPDLQKERDTATFDPAQLKDFLNGGKEANARRHRLARLVYSQWEFDNRDGHLYNESVWERYQRAMQKAAKFLELKQRHQWTPDEVADVLGLIRFDIGFGVHYIMFVPCIEKLGTDEQQAKWLPLAQSLRVIGTYAQTELGHGTDIRHVEMTATFDESTQEFVISTPMPTGLKWWPGGLAKTCNHVVLLAQLVTQGKPRGLQPFIVPIRNFHDHSPLPGVELGDIGRRMSEVVSDNGYLILNNVRIPRENMLMRYSEVKPDGTFLKKGNDKATYATMVITRARICGIAFHMLACAATIATRYSAVRRQSEMIPGEPEPQVISYQTQQHKVLTHVAGAYALFFAKKSIDDTYNEIYGEIMQGDFSRLGQLHMQSAGLKAFGTDLAASGSEVLRRACGGHGFLYSSSFPMITLNINAAVTYEGENTVLYLQVARYLLKKYSEAQSGSAVQGSFQFLQNSPGGAVNGGKPFNSNNYPFIIAAFQKRSQHMLRNPAESMQVAVMGGAALYQAWDINSVGLNLAAKAYMDQLMVEIFVSGVERAGVDAASRAAMSNLCRLFTVGRLLLSCGEFLECGALTPEQVGEFRKEEVHLLAAIRPDAVTLVDAFDQLDQELMCSTLGRYDGQVYRALFDAAKQGPMNKEQVHPAFTKYVLPFVKGTAKL